MTVPPIYNIWDISSSTTTTIIEAELGFLITLSMFMDMPELIALLLVIKDKVWVIWAKAD